MADLVSPGVQIKEKDLTTTVTSPPGSIGAVAIVASTRLCRYYCYGWVRRGVGRAVW